MRKRDRYILFLSFVNINLLKDIIFIYNNNEAYRIVQHVNNGNKKKISFISLDVTINDGFRNACITTSIAINFDDKLIWIN